MKNLIIFAFSLFVSVLGNSQTVNSTIDQSRYHGKFLSMIKENSTDTLVAIYHQNGFHRMVKTLYLDGECQWARETSSDSEYLAVLKEIKDGLPNGMKLTPTKTVYESSVNEYYTDKWEYINKFGQECEVEVYFVDGLLNNLGYWIHK